MWPPPARVFITGGDEFECGTRRYRVALGSALLQRLLGTYLLFESRIRCYVNVRYNFFALFSRERCTRRLPLKSQSSHAIYVKRRDAIDVTGEVFQGMKAQ